MLLCCCLKCGQMKPEILSQFDRCEIVVLHKNLMLSQRQIARMKHVHPSTVSRVLHGRTDDKKLIKPQKRGRKRLLHPAALRGLKRIIRGENNLTSAEIASRFSFHFNIDISPRSIRRYRRFYFHPVFEVLQKRLSLDHHLQRLDFCMTHDTNTFHCILFSDEKLFVLEHTSGTVWIEEGQRPPILPLSASHTTIMVWAGVWYHGRTELAIVEGNINHRKYIDILSSHLLPSMPTSSNFLFIARQCTSTFAYSRRTLPLHTWSEAAVPVACILT